MKSYVAWLHIHVPYNIYIIIHEELALFIMHAEWLQIRSMLPFVPGGPWKPAGPGCPGRPGEPFSPEGPDGPAGPTLPSFPIVQR